MDEFTGERFDIRVEGSKGACAVIHQQTDLFTIAGIPQHVRSDNCSEFMRRAVPKRPRETFGCKRLRIGPGVS